MRENPHGAAIDRLLTDRIIQLVVAVMVLTGLALLVALYKGTNIGEIFTLFGTLAGAIVAKFGTRYDNAYGSSASSANKDIIIAELNRKANSK